MMQGNSLTGYKTVSLFGMEIHALSMKEVLNICEKYIHKKRSLLLSVVNVAKVVNCRKNAKLRRSLAEADIVLTDGLPIVWFSKLVGNPLPERVAGIDIMYELLKLASRRNYRVFFLGAREEVVQKVVETVQLKYPGVYIAGFRNGYFNETEEKEIVEEIRKSRADILFVAMSSPKKEIFLKKWRDHMLVPVCHGVGGSFDIVAGVTKRAPVWMQKCGMEWFYRLIQEPRKMWKRYLVTNTIFIKIALDAVVRARFGRLLHKSWLESASSNRREE